MDRVAHVLLNGSYQMQLAVLRTTPINPPNGETSMFTSDQLNLAAHHFSKLKITDYKDMICFIKFKAVERDQVGAMTFETKFAADLPALADRAGWVPCWFLPWSSARIIKLKIPSLAAMPTIAFPGTTIDPVDNPSLFFTAGINGCSVFAVGAADAPSVYHGGLNPGSGVAMPLQPNETTEAAWRRLLGRAATAKFVGSVGKTDYISELNVAAADDNDRVRHGGMKTTARAAAMEAQLELRGELTKVSVSPWGAVFGLRDPAGNWMFSLVQNSTVSYHRVVTTVKKRWFKPNKTIRTEVGEDRGELKGYPISNSYNLGYKEFFPGVGAAVVRNVDLTQIM
jgi:hypothetical protein